MSKIKIKLIHPLWYQRPIIDALEGKEYKYVVGCLSRRIGKSILAKNFLVKYALTHDNACIGYVTPTSDLSRKFIKALVKALKGTNAIEASNLTDKFIEFTNGSIVYFMSAESGDNNRGSGFDLLIYDEAAYIGDDVYNYVFKAMEMQAKKVLLISTPNGSAGFFATAFERGQSNDDKDKHYISFRTTLAESGLYGEDVVNDIRESVSSIVYAQEYDCCFLSDGISCFGTIPYIEAYADKTERLFAGIDFSGDGADESMITIVNDRCEMVFQKAYKRGNTASLDDMADILNKYNVYACYAEKNSMGSVSIDYISKRFRKIEALTTTNETKREYVENVILNFQQKIGGVVNSTDNTLQFGNFIMKRTPTGKITYCNSSDNIHDDRPISYCLACLAVRDMGTSYCFN